MFLFIVPKIILDVLPHIATEIKEKDYWPLILACKAILDMLATFTVFLGIYYLYKGELEVEASLKEKDDGFVQVNQAGNEVN